MSLKFFNRSWKRLLLTAFCVCVSADHGPTVARQEQNSAEGRGRVDWIFVLDTSASMRDAGGARDIFDEVKRALEKFINAAEQGDSVTFYTFDRDTTPRPTVRIMDETDRRDLRSTLRGLDANGDRTYTGKAVHDALERALELGERGKAEHRRPSIVLLTDGVEDVRGIPNPVSIPSNVQRIPGEPYIFYVSLGTELDSRLEEFVRGQGGKVIRAPDEEKIQQLVDAIRQPLEQPTPTPIPTPTPTPVQVNISVEPINLDFGEVKPGKQTRGETLNLSSNVDIVVQLSLEDRPPGINLAEPSAPIALKAGQPTPVEVLMNVADDAADGARTFLLTSDVRDDVGSLPSDAVIKRGRAEGRLAVMHVSLLRTLSWWVAVILLVSVVALTAYCVYAGTTPWRLYGWIIGRRLLEGELEMLRPRPAQPEQAYIDLGRLNSRRVVLSKFVPDGAARDADAELEAAYAKGVKSVRLRRTQGGVRVNGAEVAFADLYDGDTVELGDARLRFNWIYGQRRDETGDGIN
jgi:Mg-chelatase subunit ChlD